MPRRKPEETVPPGIVVLYTSLMILLLAFFILFNALGRTEETKVEAALQSLAGTFGFHGGGSSPLSSRGSATMPGLRDAPLMPADADYLTLRGLAKAIEANDRYTIGHSERVACNAAIVGMRLDMEENDLRQLYWAGLLHDLGKLGVPGEILHKPGRLEPGELESVRQHSRIGDEILSRISPLFYSIADGVRHHHEKWDGSGYPDGLREDEIPFFARVLAVCDVFDALTSERTYRASLLPPEAMDLIREGAGTHLDPEVVEQFLKAYQARELVWTENHRPCSEPEEFDYGFIWDYYTNRYRGGEALGWLRG